MNARLEAIQTHAAATMRRRTSVRHHQADDGWRQFPTRNLKGTRAEMALSVLAYNILRAINIKAVAA